MWLPEWSCIALVRHLGPISSSGPSWDRDDIMHLDHSSARSPLRDASCPANATFKRCGCTVYSSGYLDCFCATTAMSINASKWQLWVVSAIVVVKSDQMSAAAARICHFSGALEWLDGQQMLGQLGPRAGRKTEGLYPVFRTAALVRAPPRTGPGILLSCILLSCIKSRSIDVQRRSLPPVRSENADARA